jgi:hypothetical protein
MKLVRWVQSVCFEIIRKSVCVERCWDMLLNDWVRVLYNLLDVPHLFTFYHFLLSPDIKAKLYKNLLVYIDIYSFLDSWDNFSVFQLFVFSDLFKVVFTILKHGNRINSFCWSRVCFTSVTPHLRFGLKTSINFNLLKTLFKIFANCSYIRLVLLVFRSPVTWL